MDFWLSLGDFGFSNTMLYRTSVFRKVDAKVGGPDWWLNLPNWWLTYWSYAIWIFGFPYQILGFLILCYTGHQYLEKLIQKWGTRLVA